MNFRAPSRMPSMQRMEQPATPYQQYSQPHYSHRGHQVVPASPRAPPTPSMSHSRLPTSPVMRSSHPYHTPPTSPDRYSSPSPISSSSGSNVERQEAKMLKQLCAAMTKMQGTMKDVAERQEQILDRMSLLEQKGS